jgi:hypothetical protein
VRHPGHGLVSHVKLQNAAATCRFLVFYAMLALFDPSNVSIHSFRTHSFPRAWMLVALRLQDLAEQPRYSEAGRTSGCCPPEKQKLTSWWLHRLTLYTYVCGDTVYSNCCAPSCSAPPVDNGYVVWLSRSEEVSLAQCALSRIHMHIDLTI